MFGLEYHAMLSKSCSFGPACYDSKASHLGNHPFEDKASSVVDPRAGFGEAAFELLDQLLNLYNGGLPLVEPQVFLVADDFMSLSVSMAI